FAVPVRGELIIGVFSRAANRECSSGWITGGNQKTVGCTAALVALEIQEFSHDRIECRGFIFQESLRNGNIRTIRPEGRNRRTNEGARREPAALPRALIIHKEIAQLFLANRSTEARAKNILFDNRSCLALPVQKEVVRIEHIIPKKLVGIAVIFARS